MTNRDIVSHLYEAFAARDEPKIEALLHSEVVWAQMAGFPGGDVRRGRAEVLEGVLRGNRRRWKDFAARVDEVVADGDRVVALGRYVLVDGAGRTVEVPFAHAYRVEDGRIVRFDQFTDTRVLADVQ